MINNKKGGEKLFSIWWFLILGVVAIVIVSGVVIFLSKDVDVRSLEASVLNAKILTCLSNNSLIEEEIFDKNFDLVSYCSLDRKVLDTYFYVNLTIKDFSGNTKREIILGNTDYESHCEVIFQGSNNAKVTAINYPICFYNSESIVYLSDKEKMNGKIEILTASNNVGKRFNF